MSTMVEGLPVARETKVPALTWDDAGDRFLAAAGAGRPVAPVLGRAARTAR